MGESIEFDRAAVQFDQPGDNGYGAPMYLLVHETGSDNAFNHDGTLARSWSYYTYGTMADVMQHLALAARDIEQGMVRYQNGKTKIENYLRNWRTEMTDDVLTPDEFATRFHLAELRIHHPTEQLPDENTYNQPNPRDVFNDITDTWRRSNPDDVSDGPVYHADISENTLQQFASIADHTHVTIDF